MKGKIFNAQEVQAIIAGNKTMFREVIKKQPPHDFKTTEKTIQLHNNIFCNTGENYDFYFGVAPYQVGQKIFVKESFVDLKTVDLKWEPAQDMKQEQSRITLEITSIKVERLQDISEDDAIKEGATSRPHCHGYANIYNGWSMDWSKVGEASKWASNRKTLSESDVCMGSAQYAFGNYWNATHKKVEHKWEANPFVWVVDFKIYKITITSIVRYDNVAIATSKENYDKKILL